MNLTYKIYYSLTCELNAAQKRDRDMVITAISPIRAIDIFHKNVQSFPSKNANGVILRPVLTASDYKIISFVQRYQDTSVNLGGTGGWIESAIDLPSSPNPEIGVKTKVEPVVQTEMKLDDTRTHQSTNHEEAQPKAI